MAVSNGQRSRGGRLDRGQLAARCEQPPFSGVFGPRNFTQAARKQRRRTRHNRVWHRKQNRSMVGRVVKSGWRHSRRQGEAKRLFGTCSGPRLLQAFRLIATSGASLHHRNLSVTRKFLRNGERLLKLADLYHQLLHL